MLAFLLNGLQFISSVEDVNQKVLANVFNNFLQKQQTKDTPQCNSALTVCKFHIMLLKADFDVADIFVGGACFSFKLGRIHLTVE